MSSSGTYQEAREQLFVEKQNHVSLHVALDNDAKKNVYFQAKSLKASPTPPAIAGPVPQPPGKAKGSPLDAKAAQQTDEILNSILPPR